jgi:hypothetical protein
VKLTDLGVIESAGSLLQSTLGLSQLVLMDGDEAWHDASRGDASPAPLSSSASREPLPLIGTDLDAQTEVPATLPLSPHLDDTTDELRPLHDLLAAVSVPVQDPLLRTPPTRKKKQPIPATSPRRSGRIAIKKKVRQITDGAEAIQELIARVCGILAPAASFDDAARAAYQQMFAQAPLAAATV